MLSPVDRRNNTPTKGAHTGYKRNNALLFGTTYFRGQSTPRLTSLVTVCCAVSHLRDWSPNEPTSANQNVPTHKGASSCPSWTQESCPEHPQVSETAALLRSFPEFPTECTVLGETQCPPWDVRGPDDCLWPTKRPAPKSWT